MACELPLPARCPLWVTSTFRSADSPGTWARQAALWTATGPLITALWERPGTFPDSAALKYSPLPCTQRMQQEICPKPHPSLGPDLRLQKRAALALGKFLLMVPLQVPSWQWGGGQLSEEYDLGLHLSPSAFFLFDLGQGIAASLAESPNELKNTSKTQGTTLS